MSEYIDVYIDTTTKVPEDATEFDYELFERFMSGGPWVAHSEYMRLKAENAKLWKLIADVHEALCADKAGMFHKLTLASMEDDMRELEVEVDG